MHNIPCSSGNSEEETAVYRPSLSHKTKRAIINCGLLPAQSSDLTAIQSPALPLRWKVTDSDSRDSDDSFLSELVEMMQDKTKVLPVRKGRRVVLKARSTVPSPEASHEGSDLRTRRSPLGQRRGLGKAGFALLSPRHN